MHACHFPGEFQEGCFLFRRTQFCPYIQKGLRSGLRLGHKPLSPGETRPENREGHQGPGYHKQMLPEPPKVLGFPQARQTKA